MRRRSVALLGAAFLLSFLAGDARAEAPFAQAWWWAPNDAALPATPPAVPTITLPLSPPDVPEDALYVATNPTGMEAMAALLYVLPEGSTATTLTLEVTGATAGTPKVQLCPTSSAWAQAHAGAWGSRPQYVCAPNVPVGTLASDGTSMTWALGALGATQAFDVALVPVVGTDLTASTSRITFAKPGPQSLSVSAAPAEVVEESFSLGPVEPPAPVTSFDSIDVIAASGSAFTGGGGLDFAPAVKTPAAVEGVAPRTNFVNPVPRAGGLAANVVARPTARDNLQTVGMFGLILLAAIYARFSGQPAREPRSLVRFAKHGAGEGRTIVTAVDAPSVGLSRRRLLVIVAAVLVLIPTLMTLRIHWGSLTRTDAPLTFRPDRRLSMVSPEEEAEVALPLIVKWDVEDFAVESGNRFGVFVDTDIPSPDSVVRLRVCSTREQLPPAPGEFRGVCKDQREKIFFTQDTSFTLECFEPRFNLGARRLNDHRVTVILLDGENRRIGEAAASVPFRVDPDDAKKCRGL